MQATNKMMLFFTIKVSVSDLFLTYANYKSFAFTLQGKYTLH